MASNSVILTLDGNENVSSKPLLLQNILFSPAAVWLYQALRKAGAQRFFVVSDEKWLSETKDCFPDAEVCSANDPALPERMAQFKAGAQGGVVLKRAMWLSLAGARAMLEGHFVPMDETPAGEIPHGIPLDCPADLDKAARLCRRETVRRLSKQGVRFLDPATVYIDPLVEIGEGTLLLPNTILRGKVTIGKNCEIGPSSVIRDAVVGDDTTVNQSQINECTVGSRVSIGPFAYIRPNTVVGDDVKVGDFVELKNSSIGTGTKISHLTYVGDSDVGQRVNFGCGTVTVNYDGNRKYRTTIEDDCFIGCNTNLVAPVTVERGAFTAAGATITDTVPADSLAIARARQEVKPGWAVAHRAKKTGK